MSGEEKPNVFLFSSSHRQLFWRWFGFCFSDSTPSFTAAVEGGYVQSHASFSAVLQFPPGNFFLCPVRAHFLPFSVQAQGITVIAMTT